MHKHPMTAEAQKAVDEGLLKYGECSGCGSIDLLWKDGENDGLCFICIKVKESK